MFDNDFVILIKKFIGRLMIMLMNAIVLSLVVYIIGYLGGIVVNKLIGQKIVECLNILIGEGRVMRDQIPLICGVLGVFGNFFRLSTK